MKNVLVSACLLGTPCRYDGKEKPCAEVIALSKFYHLIPICPEVLGGLPTPRLPAEFDGEKAIRHDGVDVTSAFEAGARKTLAIAKGNQCTFAILKDKSPSCGKRSYDGTFSRCLENKAGITAALLIENGIAVYSEEELEQIPLLSNDSKRNCDV